MELHGLARALRAEVTGQDASPDTLRELGCCSTTTSGSRSASSSRQSRRPSRRPGWIGSRRDVYSLMYASQAEFHLDDASERALKRLAARTGRSEASHIRRRSGATWLTGIEHPDDPLERLIRSSPTRPVPTTSPRARPLPVRSPEEGAGLRESSTPIPARSSRSSGATARTVRSATTTRRCARRVMSCSLPTSS